MAWEVFNRDDSYVGHDVPFVSVGPHHFIFSAVFARIASLQPGSFVTVHVDSENRKVGFEFHNEKRNNAFALSPRAKRSSVGFSVVGLLRKYAWIRSVSCLSSRNRRFTPVKEGRRWVI